MSEYSIHNEKNVLYPAEYLPVAEHFLKRPDVDQMLRFALKKPLTTVIAGAGYGKTQAVLSALDEMDCSAAWIQMSKLDNHAARFWERVAGAFKQWSPTLHDNLLSLGYPESIASFDRFLRLLTREVSRLKPFVLVLDDFYLINNEGILNFVELLVSAGVPNFSTVLVSRKKPDISLAGMLSKGLLARVTEDDLRFSEEETRAYFRTQGIAFSESVLRDVYSFTGGWIFAIYLISLTAQKGEIHNPGPLVKIDIFDLIQKEVFDEVSEKLQTFLIKLAVFDNVPSGLLTQLAGRDLSLISEMAELGMFIRYDSFSDSYRIHQLFREFLMGKEGSLQENELFETRLSAADWYARNNYVFDAIDQYKETGHYREIFEFIIAIPGRVLFEAAEKIVNFIEQAPEDMLREMPVIRVVKAGYMFNNNRLDEARRELIQLREEREALPKTRENKALLGEVYLLLAVICMSISDYTFEELFKKADKYLPEGSRLVDHRTGMAEGVNACSIKSPAAGELKRYQDALFRAAPHMAKAMNGSGFGLEYLNAAESSLYTGDLKAAEKYAFLAIYRSRQYMQYDVEYMAIFVLVRIFTSRGNYIRVNELMNQMKNQLETLQHAECIAIYDVICGWFHTKLGKTDEVAVWIKYEEETRKILAPVVIGREYLVRSDCLMAEERYFELLAFMDQTDKIYEERGILFAVIQNKITKAIVHHYMGNRAESLRFLNEAYELSHPNDLIIQYIEYGSRMRTLIHSARQNKRCGIPANWLDQIYTKSSSYAKMLSQLVFAYDAVHAKGGRAPVDLSKREMEILVYLCRGMTRKEMAVNCYVTLSTVNSMLKNIYNKLGAANSAEAVRIAKDKYLL